MSTLIRRFRALLIALAVLAISATAALAGRSALSAPTPQAASQQEDGDEQAETETGEAPEANEPDADPDEDADQDQDADAPEAEAAAPDAAGVHPDNHGKLVSEAATAPTPDGFDNHGAYVRTVAKANHGHEDAGPAAATSTKKKGKGGSH